MQSFFVRRARLLSCASFCAAALVAGGCHNHNLTSGFGICWVTLTDSPGDFAAYQINVDSVSLTGKNVGLITAVGAVETVDLTKLKDISELWSSASIPNDTYTSVTMVVDYTNANIAIIRNGVPVKAAVVDTTGKAVTTQTITITLDPNHPLVIAPTYASTSAQRLALNFDMAASNVINTAPTVPTVTIKPIITASVSASDTKPVRVRGPLINSSVNIGTYTVYVRPFFDEINSLGSLTLFTDVDKPTVFLLNGSTYVGAAAGVKALSETSAGTTITAAYTTYEPTPDAAQNTSAGKFNAFYVVAGSTLEDFYTQGLEGDVVARTGSVLKVRGPTVQFNDGTSIYYESDATVSVGPKTIVTADDNPNLADLDYNSISVGQHIIARGLYKLVSTGVVSLDATGSSSTNTGSVRLMSTQLFGSVLSSGAGGLAMDVSSIGYWPASAFTYTGTGPAASNPASYAVDAGSLPLPSGVATGSPVWVNGVVAPFGSAPPDFVAASIRNELSVPARLQVDWNSGALHAFSSATSAGLVVDLTDIRITSAVIRVGDEAIDMKTLAASPLIAPQATPATTAGVPAPFLPLFSMGSLTAANTTTITTYNSFATYLAYVAAHLTASAPAFHLVANGHYNRGNNTFTASSIDIVN